MFNLFRNLQLARTTPSVFAWSLWKGTAGNPGKLDHHATAYVLIRDAVACYGQGGMNKMQSGTYVRKDGSMRRTVFAFFRGVALESETMPEGVTLGRPITINPLPRSEGGRDEWTFRYATDSDGNPYALTEERPEAPRSLPAVIATPNGLFEALTN